MMPFLSHVPSLTTLQPGLAKLLTGGVEVWQLWDLLPSLLENKQADTVISVLTVTKFWIKMFGVAPVEGINIGDVLQTVQQGGLGDEGVKVQLQILEVMNVMISRSGGEYNPGLKEIYSADTFKLLLKIITSSQGQQKQSAVETFSGIN